VSNNIAWHNIFDFKIRLVLLRGESGVVKWKLHDDPSELYLLVRVNVYFIKFNGNYIIENKR